MTVQCLRHYTSVRVARVHTGKSKPVSPKLPATVVESAREAGRGRRQPPFAPDGRGYFRITKLPVGELQFSQEPLLKQNHLC